MNSMGDREIPSSLWVAISVDFLIEPMAAQNDSSNEVDSQEENGPRLDLTGQFQWSLNGTSLKRLMPFILGLLGSGSVIGGGWAVLQDKLPPAPSEPTVEQPMPDRIPSDSLSVRYTCDQIRDRQTAQQLLAEGHTYLDRDKDGVACE
jgi:hypothetical protein